MLKNRVKELRARHGFSQTDLATLTGVTRQTIGFIEKGRIFTIDYVMFTYR